ELLEWAGKVEASLLPGAPFAESSAECVQPVEAPPHPAAPQPRERALDPQPRQCVVGQLLEQLTGGQLGSERILRVVPARVAGLHPTSLRRGRGNVAAQPVPRPVVSARRDRPNEMNDAMANGIQGLVRNGSSLPRTWAIAKTTSGPNPYT